MQAVGPNTIFLQSGQLAPVQSRACASSLLLLRPLGRGIRRHLRPFSSSRGRWRQGRKGSQPSYMPRCFKSSPSCSAPTGLVRFCGAGRRPQRPDDSLTCRLGPHPCALSPAFLHHCPGPGSLGFLDVLRLIILPMLPDRPGCPWSI